MIRLTLGALLAAAAGSLLCTGLLAQSTDERPPVDVELVLAVDISYSMDFDELELQRQGYLRALMSEQFLDALRRGPIGRIAVTYVEWAGAAERQIIVPWHVIDGPESADAFAGKLRDAPLKRAYRTSISSALKFSADLFGTNYKGIRRVIDVSGDGTNNQGDFVAPTRDEVTKKGITINGLPIMLKTPLASMIDLPELDVYFEDCVIGGPGAFLVPVRLPEQFPDAIRKKLVLEVAGLTPRKIPVPGPLTVPAVTPPRVSCTIGEQMWQRRWGGGVP